MGVCVLRIMPWLKCGACGWWQTKRGPCSSCGSSPRKARSPPATTTAPARTTPPVSLPVPESQLRERWQQAQAASTNPRHTKLERLCGLCHTRNMGAKPTCRGCRQPLNSFYTIVPCQWPPLGAPKSVLARFDSPLPAAGKDSTGDSEMAVEPCPLDQLNESQLRKESTKVEKLLAETDTTHVQAPIRRQMETSLAAIKDALAGRRQPGQQLDAALAKHKRCIKACDLATEHLHACEQNLLQAREQLTQAQAAVQEAEEEVARVRTLVATDARPEPPLNLPQDVLQAIHTTLQNAGIAPQQLKQVDLALGLQEPPPPPAQQTASLGPTPGPTQPKWSRPRWLLPWTAGPGQGQHEATHATATTALVLLATPPRRHGSHPIARGHLPQSQARLRARTWPLEHGQPIGRTGHHAGHPPGHPSSHACWPRVGGSGVPRAYARCLVCALACVSPSAFLPLHQPCMSWSQPFSQACLASSSAHGTALPAQVCSRRPCTASSCATSTVQLESSQHWQGPAQSLIAALAAYLHGSQASRSFSRASLWLSASWRVDTLTGYPEPSQVCCATVWRWRCLMTRSCRSKTSWPRSGSLPRWRKWKHASAVNAVRMARHGSACGSREESGGLHSHRDTPERASEVGVSPFVPCQRPASPGRLQDVSRIMTRGSAPRANARLGLRHLCRRESVSDAWRHLSGVAAVSPHLGGLLDPGLAVAILGTGVFHDTCVTRCLTMRQRVTPAQLGGRMSLLHKQHQWQQHLPRRMEMALTTRVPMSTVAMRDLMDRIMSLHTLRGQPPQMGEVTLVGVLRQRRLRQTVVVEMTLLQPTGHMKIGRRPCSQWARRPMLRKGLLWKPRPPAWSLTTSASSSTGSRRSCSSLASCHQVSVWPSFASSSRLLRRWWRKTVRMPSSQCMQSRRCTRPQWVSAVRMRHTCSTDNMRRHRLRATKHGPCWIDPLGRSPLPHVTVDTQSCIVTLSLRPWDRLPAWASLARQACSARPCFRHARQIPARHRDASVAVAILRSGLSLLPCKKCELWARPSCSMSVCLPWSHSPSRWRIHEVMLQVRDRPRPCDACFVVSCFPVPQPFSENCSRAH